MVLVYSPKYWLRVLFPSLNPPGWVHWHLKHLQRFVFIFLLHCSGANLRFLFGTSNSVTRPSMRSQFKVLLALRCQSRQDLLGFSKLLLLFFQSYRDEPTCGMFKLCWIDGCPFFRTGRWDLQIVRTFTPGMTFKNFRRLPPSGQRKAHFFIESF